MKRLFQITDTQSGKQHGETFYSDKMVAKRERKRLNEEGGHEIRFVVSPGPDHHKKQNV
jgi:hypothetical protein